MSISGIDPKELADAIFPIMHKKFDEMNEDELRTMALFYADALDSARKYENRLRATIRRLKREALQAV